MAYTSLITLPGTTIYSEFTTAVTTTASVVTISTASVTTEIAYTSIYTVSGTLVTDDVTTTVLVQPAVQTFVTVLGASTYLTTQDETDITTVFGTAGQYTQPAGQSTLPTAAPPVIFSTATNNPATGTGSSPAVFTGAASRGAVWKGGYLVIAVAGVMAYF